MTTPSETKDYSRVWALGFVALVVVLWFSFGTAPEDPESPVNQDSASGPITTTSVSPDCAEAMKIVAAPQPSLKPEESEFLFKLGAERLKQCRQEFERMH